MADDALTRGTRSRCPTCDRPVAPVGNPARPFCSRRCQLIDLGGWLDERYRVAGPPVASVAAPLDDG